MSLVRVECRQPDCMTEHTFCTRCQLHLCEHILVWLIETEDVQAAMAKLPSGVQAQRTAMKATVRGMA